MPRSKDYIPIMSLHKASRQAVVCLNGRDHYLGRHGSEAATEAYSRLIAEWLSNGRRLPAAKKTIEPIIADLIADYLEFREATSPRRKGPQSYSNSKDALDRLFNLYGSLPIAEFTPKQLRSVRDALIRGGLAPRTANDRIRRIKTAFRWGVVEGLVPANVLHGLEALRGLRVGPPEIKPPNLDDVRKTILAATPVIGAMIQVQALTGMRSGELCSIQGSDINSSRDVWVYTPAEHKTKHLGSKRVIYIGPKAQSVMRPFITGAKYVFNSPKYQKPYLTNGYYQMVRKAIRAAKVDHWHPHQLRHLTATVVRAEFGVEIAQGISGHKSLAATEIYAEKNAAGIIEAARRIG